VDFAFPARATDTGFTVLRERRRAGGLTVHVLFSTILRESNRGRSKCPFCRRRTLKSQCDRRDPPCQFCLSRPEDATPIRRSRTVPNDRGAVLWPPGFASTVAERNLAATTTPKFRDTPEGTHSQRPRRCSTEAKACHLYWDSAEVRFVIQGCWLEYRRRRLANTLLSGSADRRAIFLN
jgi:hypothetical protein